MPEKKVRTYKILKQQREIPKQATENLKYYTKMKKAILNALKQGPMTPVELAKKLNMPTDEVFFYLMSLQKYGFVVPDGTDDMDEYFYYKLKNNG